MAGERKNLESNSGSMQGMNHSKKRPVFLNLLIIRLPVGGVVSIIHRVTGVLLVLLLPAMIYLFEQSLSNISSYQRITGFLESPWGGVWLLVLLAIFLQHLFSGIRHLLLDIDIGISKGSARKTAWFTLLLTAVSIALAGVVLWNK